MVIQTTRRWKSKNKFGIRNSLNNDKKKDNDDDDDDDDGDGTILEIYYFSMLIFHRFFFIFTYLRGNKPNKHSFTHVNLVLNCLGIIVSGKLCRECPMVI